MPSLCSHKLHCVKTSPEAKKRHWRCSSDLHSYTLTHLPYTMAVSIFLKDGGVVFLQHETVLPIQLHQLREDYADPEKQMPT